MAAGTLAAEFDHLFFENQGKINIKKFEERAGGATGQVGRHAVPVGCVRW
jgi:hypothetical protein